MQEEVIMENTKKQLDYILAHSIRDLLTKVNAHNTQCPASEAILKEDIVDILKEEDTFILLYYK